MIRTDRGVLDGRVLIASSVPHPECAGRDLDQIAAEWNMSKTEATQRPTHRPVDINRLTAWSYCGRPDRRHSRYHAPEPPAPRVHRSFA